VLAAPIAPFYMDQLYTDLNRTTGREQAVSVHLADFPKVNSAQVLPNLETQMDLAQKTCSLVLALRKKQHIRVRQPLQKVMIPVLNEQEAANFRHVADLICSEVNVKELALLTDTGILVKSIKPNFKTIGPKYGKQMKAISALVQQFGQQEIAQIEQNAGWSGTIEGETITLDLADFEIQAQDIPGWLVANEGGLTVALDVTITAELKAEGIAREVVNRIQNLRKESALEVTDRILVQIDTTPTIQAAIAAHKSYICAEVLANDIQFETLAIAKTEEIEAVADTAIQLSK
jgi:isoleucyl-tRNA synthetase